MLKLTKYGRPQTYVFPIIIIGIMGLFFVAGFNLIPNWCFWLIEALLAAALAFTLSFFRDPDRTIPNDNSLLLAPADGKITDIETVQNEYIASPALRIGIFLSIFNVHINRSPCNAKIQNIIYKKGQFKNAASPNSGRSNESNNLYLIRTDAPADKIIVRQISGAIARRIVCSVNIGDELTGGQKFGMIKFGSRTELLLPAENNIKLLVKIGDKVKAGTTAVAKYNNLKS